MKGVEVEGWNPLGGRPALHDDEILELFAAAVFQARFRPAIVRDRWKAIRAAFASFDLAEVASWPDEKVDELLQAPGMIRNPKKLRAILRNARELRERSRECGCARAYLEAFEGRDALVEELDRWAHYVGAPSLRWLVRNLGVSDA